MRHKASQLGVDLLLIDTGSWRFLNFILICTEMCDRGLAWWRRLNWRHVSEWCRLQRDLGEYWLRYSHWYHHTHKLQIRSDLVSGNHELYVTDIAYEHFYGFSKAYGERYLNSNVQILGPATGRFEYIGQKYRYFTTKHGMKRSIEAILRSWSLARFTDHGIWIAIWFW